MRPSKVTKAPNADVREVLAILTEVQAHPTSQTQAAHLAPAICKGHCGIQLFVPAPGQRFEPPCQRELGVLSSP